MQPVTRHNNFIFFTLSLVALLLAAAIVWHYVNLR